MHARRRLTELCEVVDNGSDAIGTILEWTSPEFQAHFQSADLIISKGQGNFETLTDMEKGRTSSFNPNVKWSLKI